MSAMLLTMSDLTGALAKGLATTGGADRRPADADRRPAGFGGHPVADGPAGDGAGDRQRGQPS